ncbi:hypothetical protein T492DRAFT_982398 [Pavlovales sp. CCMP2436]|nr:hypothetical protein T492DRAFT_982398 [Pavlovales sp. CCMP2436]
MQRNVESLLSPSFIGALRRVARQAPSEAESEAAKSLEFSVVVFLEELMEHIEAMQVAEANGEPIELLADNIPRRADGSNVPAPAKLLRPRAPKPVPTLAQEEVLTVRATEVAQLSHRELLEELLTAASKDIQSLEACLQRMAADRQLSAPFIEHLRWEVDEQVESGNTRMLHILQLVVQRACLAAEGMLDEQSAAAHHLGAILQIYDGAQRRDYWRRVIVKLPAADKTQFSKVVCNVFADLGLRVQRGVDVDESLIRQLRLVRDELDEYFV